MSDATPSRKSRTPRTWTGDTLESVLLFLFSFVKFRIGTPNKRVKEVNTKCSNTVSGQVLESLARVFQLDADERAHLFILAREQWPTDPLPLTQRSSSF